MQKIIISSYDRDAHADAVLWGLRASGHPALLWQSHLFPASQALSVLFEPGEAARHTIDAENGCVGLDDVGTVWNRRCRAPQLSADIDARDRDFAQAEAEQHLAGFLATACPDAMWVNPPAAALLDTDKPSQLRLAREVGFTIPATLFSNAPDQIGGFFERHGGNVVYKSYRPERWLEGDGQESTFVNHTAAVTKEDVGNRRALAMCPGIFQERIEKAFELRVTVMGDTFFCVRIDGSGSKSGRLDFRSDYVGMRLTRCGLADDAKAMCKAFMAQAGLVFGCFDLIVTPTSELYFLEVNPMGQFLWQEEHLPDLPLLDAMCAFLVSADPHFAWKPPSAPLTFAAYRAATGAVPHRPARGTAA
jgi:glutathione synthase/RimK-type ligase-like ATP-grasp enzyme